MRGCFIDGGTVPHRIIYSPTILDRSTFQGMFDDTHEILY
jgi:hypothetical protein